MLILLESIRFQLTSFSKWSKRLYQLIFRCTQTIATDRKCLYPKSELIANARQCEEAFKVVGLKTTNRKAIEEGVVDLPRIGFAFGSTDYTRGNASCTLPQRRSFFLSSRETRAFPPPRFRLKNKCSVCVVAFSRTQFLVYSLLTRNASPPPPTVLYNLL